MPFFVTTTTIISATLEMVGGADDTVGDWVTMDGLNLDGLYINGMPTGYPANDPLHVFNFGIPTTHFQVITGLIHPGQNYLYVYQRDVGRDVSGIIFSATITVNGVGCPNANPLLGAATDCTILQSGSPPNKPFQVDITGPAGGILGNICIGEHSRLTASGNNFVSGSILLDSGSPAATCTSSAPGVNCAGATVNDLDTQSTACDAASTAATAKACTIGNGAQSLSDLAGPTHTITVPAAPRAAGVRVGRLCHRDGAHEGATAAGGC